MAREMKDSGKTWIKEIPSHWELKRIKNLILQSKDGIKIGPFGSALTNKTIGEGEFNVYSQANLISADFSATKNTINSDTFEELKNYEVFPDDICLSMMGTIGKCKKVPEGIKRGIMDSHLIKIRLQESVDSRFFEYCYDKDYGGVCFAQMQFDKKGFIMDGLNTSIVKNMYFPLPPKEEQKRISDYLDNECSHIDSVIEQTRASIEEYRKLKQAVITQAVTKGIRPDRPVKDSGVDWLGIVPESWSILRIANLYDERNESGSDDLPILTVSINTGISDHEIPDEEKARVVVRSEDKSKYKRVYPGDLAYNMMRAWQGAFGAVRTDGMISPAYVVAKPKVNTELDSRYIEALLRTPSAIEEMHRYSHGITDFRLRLYWPEFKNIRVCVPPIEEQQEIADYIDIKSSQIDDLIAKKEKAVEELDSYKKSLIYEYVTGKKEVPA